MCSVPAALIGGSIAASVINKPKTPKIPEPERPKAPPQASKAPSLDYLRSENRRNAMGGASSTFLTGASGIPNLGANLGTNTLLGG